MNKNSYSNVSLSEGVWHIQHGPTSDTYINDGCGMISLGYNDMPQKKEKTMENYKEFPFHCEWQSFKTLAEATVFARKQVMNSKEDVVIKQNVAIVKFPVPDYEVETLATVA